MEVKSQHLINFINHNYAIIIAASVLTLLLVFINEFAVVGAVAFIFLLFIFLIKEDDLLRWLAVVSLLTITGNLGESVRLVVQIGGISLLTYIFAKNYILNKSPFPSLPMSVKYFLVIFYCAIILSSITSPYPALALRYIVKISTFFLIVYFIYADLSRNAVIKVYLYSLLTVILILTVSIVYEFASFGFNLIDTATNMYFRTGGLIPNVNAAAGIFAVTLPVLWAYHHVIKNKFERVGLKLGILVSILGVTLTMSRSAFLSLFVSTIFLLFHLHRNWLKIAIGVIVAFVTVIILVTPLSDFFVFLFRIEDGVSNRGPVLSLALNIIQENWLFGTGPDAYGKYVFINLPVMLESWEGWVISELHRMTDGANISHSLYLGLFAELGILGFITAVYLTFLFFQMCNACLKATKNSDDLTARYLSMGITASGIGMFVRAHFDNVNIITNGYLTTDLPFWIIFIILVFLYQNIRLTNLD